jgi:hypothetical protein
VKPVKEMTAGELAAFIQSHLRDRGIDVVLTGGSAVAIYSQGKYVSKDLDLVVEGLARRSRIVKAMGELGFRQVRRHFEHPEAVFLVEFPGGPLSVGRQPVRKIESLEFETGILRIISPADSVKDRLAAYYYWNDHQSLEQAVLVAWEHHVDLDEIAGWSRQEGKLDEFKQIEGRLRNGGSGLAIP